MARQYAEPDREVVDYQLYCLDAEVLDPVTRSSLEIRGPAPPTLAAGTYFVCLGAAQTFGRFCEAPYPTVLAQRLGLPTLNLGRGGAGPSFFLRGTDALFGYVNRARFAVVQIMSGRSEGNSLFRSDGLGFYHRLSDGKPIGADEAFRELLRDRDLTQRLVEETRNNWVANSLKLLRRIEVPTILLWLSVRPPDYREGYGSVAALFGEFPQLVNETMLEPLRAVTSAYVECVTRRGMPQRLVSRLNGAPVTVRDPWGGAWSENSYYPTPEMHVDAADALERPCRALLGCAHP